MENKEIWNVLLIPSFIIAIMLIVYGAYNSFGNEYTDKRVANITSWNLSYIDSKGRQMYQIYYNYTYNDETYNNSTISLTYPGHRKTFDVYVCPASPSQTSSFYSSKKRGKIFLYIGSALLLLSGIGLGVIKALSIYQNKTHQQKKQVQIN